MVISSSSRSDDTDASGAREGRVLPVRYVEFI
jgi:hypothetical protein